MLVIVVLRQHLHKHWQQSPPGGQASRDPKSSGATVVFNACRSGAVACRSPRKTLKLPEGCSVRLPVAAGWQPVAGSDHELTGDQRQSPGSSFTRIWNHGGAGPGARGPPAIRQQATFLAAARGSLNPRPPSHRGRGAWHAAELQLGVEAEVRRAVPVANPGSRPTGKSALRLPSSRVESGRRPCQRPGWRPPTRPAGGRRR